MLGHVHMCTLRSNVNIHLLYKSRINRLLWVIVMVFDATFNNISVISWLPVLLVEETGVHGENHRPAASH